MYWTKPSKQNGVNFEGLGGWRLEMHDWKARESGGNRILRMFSQAAKGQLRTIDKLDEAPGPHQGGWSLRWCLCGNAAAVAPWSGVDSGSFLDWAQVAGWVAMDYMAKELQHHCTGVLVRVYVHFCGEPGVHWTGVLGTSACRCVHSTGVPEIAVNICDTITAGCAHALVYAQFVHLHWRTRVGGFNWSVHRNYRLAWVVVFKRRRDSDRSVVLCLLHFWRGWECTLVYVCV